MANVLNMEFYAVLGIIGCLLVSMIGLGSGLHRITTGRRWSGGLLVVLAIALDAAACATGASGGTLWRWASTFDPLKIFALSFIVAGVISSGIGWKILVSGKLKWGINGRLALWFPSNIFAAILFWHGTGLLLGI